jgi:hypothetical protein
MCVLILYSFKLREQILYPHKREGKIVDLYALGFLESREDERF